MSSKKISILIIEDNLDLCAIYQIAFEAAGYDVRLSPSGMDGIVKVIESKPDVILLDIMMPDMDGFEVLTAIRKNSSMDVTIVINSNINQQKDIDRAMKLNANAYLQKSDYSPSELVNKIQTIITEDNKTDQLVVKPQEQNQADILSLFFPPELFRVFTVQQVNNGETSSTVLLEEKSIAPQWGGKQTSIGGFLPPETITGLDFGKKPLVLIVQRHIWRIDGENTTVKYDIAIRNNGIVLSVQEIMSCHLDTDHSVNGKRK